MLALYPPSMRIDKKGQFSLSSHERIKDLIERFTNDLRARRRDYLGKTMSKQAVVNSLLVWLATMPEEDRYRTLDEALSKLELLVIGHPIPGFEDLTEEDRRNIRVATSPTPKRIERGAQSGPRAKGNRPVLGEEKPAGKLPGRPRRRR